MLKIFLLLFISTSAFAGGDEAAICQSYSLLNQRLGCSADNYLIQFGQKYCELYVKENKAFSPKAQAMLKNIRHCLAEDALKNPKLTCENAEELSVQSHTDCYVRSGFCDIAWRDLGLVWWFAKSETFRLSFNKTVLRLVKSCGIDS